jgi:hypothetical protein
MWLRDPLRTVPYGENLSLLPHLLNAPAPGDRVPDFFIHEPFKLITSSELGRSMVMGLQSFFAPVTRFPERSVLIIIFVDRHATASGEGSVVSDETIIAGGIGLDAQGCFLRIPITSKFSNISAERVRVKERKTRCVGSCSLGVLASSTGASPNAAVRQLFIVGWAMVSGGVVE